MQINILFYNTHLFGRRLPLVQVLKKLRYRDRERAETIAEQILAMQEDIGDCDLICLCELWNGSLHNRIKSILGGEFPFGYRPRGVLQPGNWLGSGLSIYSRHKLTSKDFVAFPMEHGVIESRSQKGVARVIASFGNGQKLVIMSTHMQSGQSTGAKRARAGQFKLVRQLLNIRRLGPSPAPMVVGGDFNVIGEDVQGVPTSEHRKMLQTFRETCPVLVDGYRKQHPNAVNAPGFTSDAHENRLVTKFSPRNDSRERLDYILYEARDTVRLIGCEIEKFALDTPLDEEGITHLSDHYAVRATFELSVPA